MSTSKAFEYVNSRSDLLAIANLIPAGASVLDLGCGNGLFLRYLVETKGIRAQGIDISQEAIIECIGNGVPVVHGDLNAKLDYCQDQSFDFVILSCTLQEMVYPHQLLAEMLRIGKKAIVGVINFGYIYNRLQLLCYGRMPITRGLPHQWYTTPNIHLSTLKDFKRLCRSMNIDILNALPLSANHERNKLARLWPNMLAVNCVFLIEKHMKNIDL